MTPLLEPSSNISPAVADDYEMPDTALMSTGVQPSRWLRVSTFLVVLIPLALTVTGFVFLAMSYYKGVTADAPAPTAKDMLFYTTRQLMWLVVAVAVSLTVCFFPLKRMKQFTWPAFVLVLGTLAAVLKFGIEVKGARRWFRLVVPYLGEVNVQPSDLGKIIVVLVLALYFSKARRYFGPASFGWFSKRWYWPLIFSADAWRDFARGFVLPCLLFGTVSGLIYLENDLGTTVLIGLVGALMLFMSGARLAYVATLGVSCLGAFAAVLCFRPEKMIRVLTFMDPAGTRFEEGHQLWQSLVAFACGGEWGVGLGKGIQHQSILPESRTDCILAIIGEQKGLLATGLVTFSFLLFFVIVATNLHRARTLYQFNICFGALMFIVCQALINMCVVTDILPTKGMSLPFLSYGGTNLVAMYVMVGLILNCFCHWAKPERGGGGEP
ncbi:MAG: FtsW/RodA/SpoVE family cell cycle protein [Puniceicoccales bacterium]|jgi:cell division protein FtsW|nr:FtsW/RodA/SpoVE family cell cycle protein [Puniceicoccales bacterium]